MLMNHLQEKTLSLAVSGLSETVFCSKKMMLISAFIHKKGVNEFTH